MDHSILWGDSALSDQEIHLDPTSTITISYSDVSGGWPGAGNIDAYPEFALGARGDYRLLWGSPCIDAGHPDSLDPDSTTIDIGTHFFDQSKQLVVYLSPENLTVHQGDTLRVRYTLVNRHPEPVSCKGVAQLYLPNGNPWQGNPLEGPGSGLLPPEFNYQYDREYIIPAIAPRGTYTLVFRVGLPPDLFDEDSFDFRVLIEQ
jgi:hypothetical protein